MKTQVECITLEPVGRGMEPDGSPVKFRGVTAWRDVDRFLASQPIEDYRRFIFRIRFEDGESIDGVKDHQDPWDKQRTLAKHILDYWTMNEKAIERRIYTKLRTKYQIGPRFRRHGRGQR